MLATLLILVFLILGIGTGMDSAVRIYDEAKFEANSASMANIVNTSLGDILRYADNLTVAEENTSFKDSAGTVVPNVDFVFTNYEYGVRDAYFSLKDSSNKDDGILRMRNLENGKVVELVNTGAYPDMKITGFELTYTALGKDDAGNDKGGYFEIKYTVNSDKSSTLTREVKYIVRCMNPV